MILTLLRTKRLAPYYNFVNISSTGIDFWSHENLAMQSQALFAITLFAFLYDLLICTAHEGRLKTQHTKTVCFIKFKTASTHRISA